MIIELTKENINEIDNSFINKEFLLDEFDNNPYAKVLLLKEDNKVIGYIYYSDIYERAEINQFEIEEIHRNSGKGNLLLKEMINRVNKDITLEVREDNLYAIKLYEKNGFIKKAIRKGYYNGIDGILMERKDSSK
ncbi:MAG: GNAT family N-acetyltransferase [Bacilli bacterium]|nr:GNAT family N-acetyltransferase [Bacilli bacterium]